MACLSLAASAYPQGLFFFLLFFVPRSSFLVPSTFIHENFPRGGWALSYTNIQETRS
jgi:hypothetical protein